MTSIRMIAQPSPTTGALYLHGVDARGVYLSATGGPDAGRMVPWDTLEASAAQGGDLGAAYASALEAALALREAQIDESSWYALAWFGSPSLRAADVTVPEVAPGRGLAARDRLIGVASKIKGTGSCSDVRVVRCETSAQANEASISDHYTVVYHA